MAECCPSAKSSCGFSPACASCLSGPGKKNAADCGIKNKPPCLATTLRSIRHPLFIISGKGGVGKSAITVNMAAALSNRGYRVGVLDVDMHGPSIPGLFGLETRLMAQGEKTLTPAYYKREIAVVSMASLLDDRDAAIIWRGPRKTAAINQFISCVAWGELDYLLIDSPPGTGDEHLAVLRAIPDAQSIMVTTPQEISLADVRKALRFLERVRAPLLGLIENMSGFSCPHCGGGIDLFSSGGGEELARDRNIPFLGRVPIDPAMLAAAGRKEPLVDLPGDFPAKDAFLRIAGEIERRLPA